MPVTKAALHQHNLSVVISETSALGIAGAKTEIWEEAQSKEIDCLERKQKQMKSSLSSPSSCNDALLTPSSS